MLISGIMQKNNSIDNGFVTIMNDFQFMQIMKQLAWFNSFLGLPYSYFTTLTQHIYKTTDTTSAAYNTGTKSGR
jgi:maltose/moltooligosaccharide transporter